MTERPLSQLRLLGAKLFASENFDAMFDSVLAAEVRTQFHRLRKAGETISKLKLRTKFVDAEIEGLRLDELVTYGAYPTRSGTIVREARIKFFGPRRFFFQQPDIGLDVPRSPKGEVRQAKGKPDQLVVAVEYHQSEEDFVRPMLEDEVALVRTLMASQKQQLAELNRTIGDRVRRVVEAEWEALRSIRLKDIDRLLVEEPEPPEPKPLHRRVLTGDWGHLDPGPIEIDYAAPAGPEEPEHEGLSGVYARGGGRIVQSPPDPVGPYTVHEYLNWVLHEHGRAAFENERKKYNA